MVYHSTVYRISGTLRAVVPGLLVALALAGCVGCRGWGPGFRGGFQQEQREGPWEFFYPEGPIWIQCEYRKGILNGPWKRYYLDGTTEETGEYTNGKPSGQWVWYYPDGRTYLRGGYLEGLKDGRWETYTAAGDLWWKGDFLKNEKVGAWEAWKGGKLRTSGEFKNGQQHGAWTQYDVNGQVRFKGWFEDGKRIGTWYEYDQFGTIVRSDHYGDGEPSGKVQQSIPDDGRLGEIKKRLQEELPPFFQITSAGPFVVASELPRYVTDTTTTYTVSWLHGHMMMDFSSKPPPVGSKTIFLFRHQESYDHYMKEWLDRSGDGVYGVMTPNKIMVNAATGTGSLVHELIHEYLQVDFQEIPFWLEEGLASLYEQSAEVEGRMVGLVNFRLRVLQDALRKGRTLSLDQLIRSDRIGIPSDDLDLFYAQARYLCYYLQECHLLRTFYRTFREDSLMDPYGSQALMKVLGKTSIKAIERDWIDYIQGLDI